MSENTGNVISISAAENESGQRVWRVVVDFYDGNMPEIGFGTIWDCRAVRVIDVTEQYSAGSEVMR